MKLHAFLVHWQRPAWCRAAVQRLLDSRSVELVVSVIDNSGDLDGLPAGVSVIRTGSNLGFAGGANVALTKWLRESGDEYCLLGAHDLLVERTTVADLVQAATANPSFGIIGPALLSRGHRKRLPHQGALEAARYVPGACMLLRRRCLKEVGLFDEEYGSYWEDLDLCLRATDVGWRVGRFFAAGARQIGTASPAASRLKFANFVLLRAKRGGLYSGAKALASLPVFGVRDLVLGALRQEERGLRNGRARLAALPSGARKLAAYGLKQLTGRHRRRLE